MAFSAQPENKINKKKKKWQTRVHAVIEKLSQGIVKLVRFFTARAQSMPKEYK